MGERVTEMTSPAGVAELRHEFVDNGSAWEWTCERCGYSVSAASRLDRALSRVQPLRLPAILAGLLGLAPRPAQGSGPSSLSTAQAVALGAGGLVLAAVAAVFVMRSPSPGPQAPSPSPDVITRIAPIASAEDATLAGRRVALRDVPVEAVTGDVTFWVGSTRERALVVLDEERQAEAAVVVRPGQRVAITGTAEALPPERVELSPDDQAGLVGQQLYVRAEQVEITSP